MTVLCDGGGVKMIEDDDGYSGCSRNTEYTSFTSICSSKFSVNMSPLDLRNKRDSGNEQPRTDYLFVMTEAEHMKSNVMIALYRRIVCIAQK